MMKSVFLASFTLLFGAAVASADETGAPVDLATKDWVLVLMDGVAPGYQATLNLDAPGRVTGISPCNRYFADLVQDGVRSIFGSSLVRSRAATVARVMADIDPAEFANADGAVVETIGGAPARPRPAAGAARQRGQPG